MLQAFLRISPHVGGHLDDARELRLLIGLAERIADDRAGEAALRAQAELLDRREPRSLVDAALEALRAFERGRLARHQSQYHDLAARKQPKRRERAGPRRVVFEKIAVRLDPVEQYIRHRVVAAF